MAEFKRSGATVIKGFIGIAISILTIISSIIGVVGSGLLLVSNKLDEGIDFVGERCCRFLEDLEREKVVNEVESDISLDSVEANYN